VLDSPCLDQNLDDINIDRLEDHFKVKDLTLGHLGAFIFILHLIGLALVLSPPPFEMLDFILIIQTTLDGLCIHVVISLLDH